MSTIAVDVDSTLYDFETPAREAMLKLYKETGEQVYMNGAYHPWTEWRSPNDVLGTERWLRAIGLVHEDDKILGMEPFRGAVETCRALVEAGHTLIFISNRAVTTEAATKQWLTEHGFLSRNGDCGGTLVVTNGDKRPLIKECQYLIDDRLKTCIEFTYDFEWEQKIRYQADRIRKFGPDENEALFQEYQLEIGRLLEMYYEDQETALPLEEFVTLKDLAEKAAELYISQNRRRAFVPAYPYNQAATDIPHLYLAPTWSGLNIYMVGKGLLPKPAVEALA